MRRRRANRLSLTQAQRDVLEFLAVADGVVPVLDLVLDAGVSRWSAAVRIVGSLTRQGLVVSTLALGDAYLVKITDAGRDCVAAVVSA